MVPPLNVTAEGIRLIHNPMDRPRTSRGRPRRDGSRAARGRGHTMKNCWTSRDIHTHYNYYKVICTRAYISISGPTSHRGAHSHTGSLHTVGTPVGHGWSPLANQEAMRSHQLMVPQNNVIVATRIKPEYRLQQDPRSCGTVTEFPKYVLAKE